MTNYERIACRWLIIAAIALTVSVLLADFAHARGMSGGGHASGSRGSHAIWNARTGR